MSYTLRGRLESRLAAALLPVLAAASLAIVVQEWWPVQVAGLMVGTGLALDLVYHRGLDYQPGWLALPLGLLELGIVMALVRRLDVEAPPAAALGLFAGAWLVAQLLGHAGFPLLALSYAEDGGELGRLGISSVAVAATVFAAAGGIAWAKLPPTIVLERGVHRGPIVLDRAQKLVGEPGAIVRGGIVVSASHVVVRDVIVVGGENGIVVDGAQHVLLDRVHVRGAAHDGIQVRRGQVTIKNCTIVSPDGYTQGIDISFSADLGTSIVEGCTVTGGREGIVIDSSGAIVRENHVSATSLRAINMNEMSMGMIERNQVSQALGVGIFCGDQSECMIERNRILGTRADHASGDLAQMGYGIESHYKSHAELRRNELVGNAGGVAVFAGATIEHR